MHEPCKPLERGNGKFPEEKGNYAKQAKTNMYINILIRESAKQKREKGNKTVVM